MNDTQNNDIYSYASLAEACREDDFDDCAPYIEGWYWGLICGVCATLFSFAIVFAIGRFIAPMF